MIAETLAAYGSEVAPSMESARNIGYHISNLLKWWHDKRVSDISQKTCKEYVKTKTAPAATADLKVLKASVKYWHGEYGPLDAMPVFWRPEQNEPRERWLTRSEAARLLWAARHYQHMRRFILLGLYTGSRSGVLLSLHWSQIDLDVGVMTRTKPGARISKKKRAPKVRLGFRILAHLRRWKRLDGNKQVVCHFTDPWNPNGREVDDPHSSWKKIVAGAKLEGVTKHTLRHTRATWMAQKGVPLWEAAGFLGMTVKTLEKVYAHHSPDFQERAANI